MGVQILQRIRHDLQKQKYVTKFLAFFSNLKCNNFYHMMPNYNYRKPNVHIYGIFKCHFYDLKVFIRWSFRPLVCYKATLMTLQEFQLIHCKEDVVFINTYSHNTGILATLMNSDFLFSFKYLFQKIGMQYKNSLLIVIFIVDKISSQPTKIVS